MVAEKEDKMATSADTLAPAGITWEQAMENAAEVLKGKWMRPGKAGLGTTYESVVAQAWIAYAREITMHARATQ